MINEAITYVKKEVTNPTIEDDRLENIHKGKIRHAVQINGIK